MFGAAKRRAVWRLELGAPVSPVTRFRFFNRLALLGFAVSVFACMFATGFLLGPGYFGDFLIPIGHAALPILFISGLYLAFVRCPECRNPFNRRGWLFDLSVRQCINCGFSPSSVGPAA
jgi:hypothetical protein